MKMGTFSALALLLILLAQVHASEGTIKIQPDKLKSLLNLLVKNMNIPEPEQLPQALDKLGLRDSYWMPANGPNDTCEHVLVAKRVEYNLFSCNGVSISNFFNCNLRKFFFLFAEKPR